MAGSVSIDPIPDVPRDVDPVAAGIDEAVEVYWISQPNRLYEVRASDDPTAPVWSAVGAPVVGTGAEVRRVLRRGDARHRFFRVEQLPGTVTNWLAGLTELDFRPARLTPEAGGLLAEGLRVNAAGISTEDLVSARFQFDEATQCLRLLHYDVVPSVGVFTDRFFVRDVGVPALQASADGTGFTPIPVDTPVTITGTNIVIRAELEVGHVLNLGLSDQTLEYAVEIVDPAGRRLSTFSGAAGIEVVTDGLPILQSGRHEIHVRPRNVPPGTLLRTTVRLANANSTTLRVVGDGQPVSATLRASTHDYAKYSMSLVEGQTVRLPAPARGIGFLVVNGRSQVLAGPKGLPLIFDVPSDGIYHLFVYKITAGEGAQGYSGTLSVE